MNEPCERRPRRVLVIGGASLVGSHLCDRLLADGDAVVAIDDLSRGTWANIAHLKREPRFAFVEHDVCQPFDAPNGIDEVFHLALPSTRETCKSDPVHAAVTNVMGTVHALDVARQHRARVVLATSSERWGDAVRCAESLALEYVRRDRIDVRVVRLPSVYGPRTALDDANVVGRLVVACLRGASLDALDDADRVHLTYVDDAIATLIRTMRSEARIPCVVAPYAETTLAGAVRAIEAAMTAGSRAHAVEEQPPEDQEIEVGEAGDENTSVTSGVVSSRMTFSNAVPASLAFNLEASVDLAEGIRRTVAWFAERLRWTPSGVFEAWRSERGAVPGERAAWSAQRTGARQAVRRAC